jgi:hypothetical protein
MNIVDLPLSSIEPNDYNPNSMSDEIFAKEIASIEEFGFLIPIVVNKKGNKFIIIDGEHRWRAAKNLGMDEVPCVLVEDMSPEKMKALTIILNSLRGEHDPMAVGHILKELEDEMNLLNIMPYDDKEIQNLISMVDIEWEDIGDMEFDESDNVGSRNEEVEFKYGDLHFKTDDETYDTIKNLFLMVSPNFTTESDALKEIFLQGAKHCESD